MFYAYILTEADDEVLAMELEEALELLPAAEDVPVDEAPDALESEAELELLGPPSAPRSKRPGARIFKSLFRLP